MYWQLISRNGHGEENLILTLFGPEFSFWWHNFLLSSLCFHVCSRNYLVRSPPCIDISNAARKHWEKYLPNTTSYALLLKWMFLSVSSFVCIKLNTHRHTQEYKRKFSNFAPSPATQIYLLLVFWSPGETISVIYQKMF